jgi:hypothetical protein
MTHAVDECVDNSLRFEPSRGSCARHPESDLLDLPLFIARAASRTLRPCATGTRRVTHDPRL